MRLKPTNRARAHALPSLAVPVLVLGLLAFAGCGSSSNSSSSSSSASTPTTPAAAASAPATTTTSATTTPASTSTSASETSGGSGTTKLSLAANTAGQLKYDTTSLSAKAGAVSIAFTNMSSIGHNVTVESSSGATVGATPTFSGESKTLSLNLKPGKYKFFCSVPGHRMAGMEGTLTVK